MTIIEINLKYARQVLVDNLSSDISKEMDAEFVQSIAKLCTDLAGIFDSISS